ncbi:hypothetical protein D0469_16160 [Peribacillus saganii]|uniref:Uncharacterized protein n=1 Tax=Peribacillus saganii TaxID=2303992 RepID=A0A372LKZ4_9BACI|nr:hypothetical protein D0469_16160 [Peribacillus saganii]
MPCISFVRCFFKEPIQCPAGKRVKGDPTGTSSEDAPEPPAESEYMERKSTGKFNRASFLRNSYGFLCLLTLIKGIGKELAVY